jgi:hypothetical protein
MPRDQSATLKQQQQHKNRLYTPNENGNLVKKQATINKNNQHQRKHSFSDIFLA